MNRRQITEEAMALVNDYRAHGIEHVEQVSQQGPVPLNVEIIKLAARWLQSDKVFSEWALVAIMEATN